MLLGLAMTHAYNSSVGAFNLPLFPPVIKTTEGEDIFRYEQLRFECANVAMRVSVCCRRALDVGQQYLLR